MKLVCVISLCRSVATPTMFTRLCNNGYFDDYARNKGYFDNSECNSGYFDNFECGCVHFEADDATKVISTRWRQQ